MPVLELNVTAPPLMPDWSLIVIVPVNVALASRRSFPDTVTPVAALPDHPDPPALVMM